MIELREKKRGFGNPISKILRMNKTTTAVIPTYLFFTIRSISGETAMKTISANKNQNGRLHP